MARFLAGVFLVATTVVVAPTTPAPAQAEVLRLSVFGDSVLLVASEEISEVLAGNNVTVDARQNLSLLGAIPTISDARPAIGDVVVLDLGYNDISDPAVWRDRVDQTMAILNGVPRVIWLSQSLYADGRAGMNAELG